MDARASARHLPRQPPRISSYPTCGRSRIWRRASGVEARWWGCCNDRFGSHVATSALAGIALAAERLDHDLEQTARGEDVLAGEQPCAGGATGSNGLANGPVLEVV